MLFFIGPVSSAAVSLSPATSVLWRGRQPDPNGIDQAEENVAAQTAPEAAEGRRPTSEATELDRMDPERPARPQSEPASETTYPSIVGMLNKDYSKEFWTGPVMGLICVHVLFLTSTILSAISDTDTSAWRPCKFYLIWLCWVQPCAIWCMILFALGLEDRQFTIGFSGNTRPGNTKAPNLL